MVRFSTMKGSVCMEITFNANAYGEPTPRLIQEPAADYLMEQIAMVFATYRVDPHDEGVPIQDVLDHLVRCVGACLGAEDREWFTTGAMLGEPVWRFDHEAHAARAGEAE